MEHTNKRKIFFISAVFLLIISVIMGLFLGRLLEKRVYKLYYPDLIEKYGKEYNLDLYLVSAVIHVESGNRKDAVSVSGAIGLMQIMPQTGEWIAKKLVVEDYTEKQLYNPETNINFGCWYLRFLLDRYNQKIPIAIAAYNAGQGRVDKWLVDEGVYKDDGFLAIPYPETEKYLAKVTHAYEKYKTLYKGLF